MTRLTITVGVDLTAYATIGVPADTDLSAPSLLALLRQEGLEDMEFVPDWATANGLRVVCATGPNGWAAFPPDEAGVSLKAFMEGMEECTEEVSHG
ncbi:MAG: hypothetical protein KJ558_10110 [Gammaproteobacteria bacterium]|nr:hypothetical protein [Gammaproteobacteria bacterium]MBU1655160.1 hypothetical protein [Gammaproteobacteria bacterium]MBU1959971.1 hypothetical protein [Gammaproteobacteria bacterium]